MDQEELGRLHFEDFERLRARRGNEESHWQEISERFLPEQSTDFYAGSFPYQKTTGEKRMSQVIDATGMVALDRFSAILDSLLTPSNQMWHILKASNEELNKLRDVQIWFEQVNKILYKMRYAPEANFVSQNQQTYQSLGAYGTGALFIDSLANGRGLRYKNIHLSQVYFKENHQGVIDTAHRFFGMTVRQAFQKWGDKLPERIRDKMEKNPEDMFYFLHTVKPREEYDPERADSKGKPFISTYVCEEGKTFIDEGGYDAFPYSISRYYQATGEVYGRSPAMRVLPASKTLNEIKKTLLKQGHRAIDPVLLAHDDGIIDGLSLTPGAINFGGVDRMGRPLVHTLPTGNPVIGKDQANEEREIINDVFLVNLFQIMVETPTMTATEVVERTREKGILLAPTVGRQNSEYLGPTIHRELDVLANQAGVIPPMPPVLVEAAGEYEIQYDSPMSRMQRAEELSGAMQSLNHTLELVKFTGDTSTLIIST